MPSSWNVSLLRPMPESEKIYGHEEPSEEFLEAIDAIGIQHALIVAELPEGGAEIVSGHSRWKAAKLLGIQQVPVDVRIFENRVDQVRCMIYCNAGREKTHLQKAREVQALWELAEQEEGSTRHKVGEAAKVGATSAWRYKHVADEIDERLKAGDVEGAARLEDALNKSPRAGEKMLQRDNQIPELEDDEEGGGPPKLPEDHPLTFQLQVHKKKVGKLNALAAQMRDLILEMAHLPTGLYLIRMMEGGRYHEFEAATKAVRQVAPYCICPQCNGEAQMNGKKCSLCEAQGWLCRATWKLWEQQTKGMRDD